ncbi:hypothetical protein [Luteimonas panaciterrae]|uniref:hypothetical protein n=1 Tax=Luteimonas panaciterrae TaxID=363885 RepID=UPI001CF9785D|nr:hypothetical protein [Luteimonas panaciterrae]
MKSYFRITLVVAGMAFASPSLAQEAIVPCTFLPSTGVTPDATMAALDKLYELGDIRVFYSTTDVTHQLPVISRPDRNSNGVPDFVENVAKQVSVARKIFNLAGFRDPLESPRYRIVSKIDVNILNLPSYNGLAYDGAIRYTNLPLRGNACTLRIDINRNLQSTSENFTTSWFVPAHEMFHLFQYGSTLYKNSMMAEPTARWSEYALRPNSEYQAIPPTVTPLPASRADLCTIINTPVSAPGYLMYTRLIELTDPRNELRIPASSISSETYVDGKAVIKDGLWRGSQIMSYLLQSLDAEDDAHSFETLREYHRWPEADQKSPTNIPRILHAIERTIDRMAITGAEVDKFKSAVAAYQANQDCSIP